jgi:folylpolyglutamate synthase
MNETSDQSNLHESYTNAWRSSDPVAEISIEPAIDGAIERARDIGFRHNGMQSLLTGSLRLVGGALRLLEGDNLKTPGEGF